MKTIVVSEGHYVHIVGRVVPAVISRRCDSCHDIFVMSCDDYIADNCGTRLIRPEEGADGWVCKTCADSIREIRDMK